MNGKLMPLAFAAALIAAPALAETVPPRQIVVTGEGLVEVAPDMATISLGVTHQGKAAMAAMAETSSATAAILERLAASGIEARDVQTRNISLTPVWTHYDRAGSAPKIEGFAASNTISVRVRDLARLGAILDTAIGDGANDFSGLSFGLQNPAPQEEEARRLAVADAMARARVLAEAAGVTLGPVQQINEMGGGRPQPMQMSMARDAGVPVAAGEVGVSVSVSVTFAIE